jgi:cell division inhibitor SulA/protein ImuA
VSDALAELLRHPALWRGTGADAPAPESIPTGFRALDARLPGGGWPRDTLVELLVPAAGVGEVRLLLPALRRLTAPDTEPRWVAWLAPPHLPYAPALADAGLDPSRMLVVRPREGFDRLWAMEQALRSGACAAVLGWTDEARGTALRRLKLAAEEGATPAFLLRPLARRAEPSPAALRIALSARDAGLDVEILKGRGGPARIERLAVH